MGDELQITELKQFLEDWREVVVASKRILLWEQQWHGTAILGANTIIFTLLWLIEPGVLPTLAVIGLLLTIGDFVMKNIVPRNPAQWTPMKEKEFDAICTNLVYYKNSFQQAWSSYYNMKTTNKKMYFGGTIAFLLVLAYIGSTVNNYLLLYITLTTLTLAPGVKYHGLLNEWWKHLNLNVRNLVDRMKNNKLVENKKRN